MCHSELQSLFEERRNVWVRSNSVMYVSQVIRILLKAENVKCTVRTRKKEAGSYHKLAADRSLIMVKNIWGNDA